MSVPQVYSNMPLMGEARRSSTLAPGRWLTTSVRGSAGSPAGCGGAAAWATVPARTNQPIKPTRVMALFRGCSGLYRVGGAERPKVHRSSQRCGNPGVSLAHGALPCRNAARSRIALAAGMVRRVQVLEPLARHVGIDLGR